MDIAARLQQLQEIVEQAKSMPLSSSVLVNKEEVLQLIEAAQGELPEEIKQARWVVKDREELLAKARRDGEAIVEKAITEPTDRSIPPVIITTVIPLATTKSGSR